MQSRAIQNVDRTRDAHASELLLARSITQGLRQICLPGKSVQDAPGRRCFEESHGRSEDGEGHAFVEFTRSLQRAYISASVRHIRACICRRTSIEQKIHSINVWTTTSRAEPMPKAK